MTISFFGLCETTTRLGIQHHCTTKPQNLRQLDIQSMAIMVNETAIEYARRIKHKTKDLALEQLQGVGKDKPLHGQYPKRLHDNDVNEIEINKWLSTSGLKSETEGFIIGAQDQCLKTIYYRHKILKDGTSPMCRICSEQQRH